MYLPDEGVYRSIEELQGRPGFRVLAVDDETGRLEPRRVTRAVATGRKPVYRLTTRLGRAIRATGNHKFLAFDGWRRLDDMAPGMEIAAPRELPGPDERTMSDQQLAILGHLLRDPISTRERRVPAEVFAQPAPVIAVFLLHLGLADALVGPSAGRFVYPISFASRSAHLVRDLQSLLLRLGIAAGRRVETDGQGAVHRLDIADAAHLERYRALVGLAQRRATAGVAAGAADRTPSSTVLWRPLAEPDDGWGDAAWDEIASIEPEGEDDVYDLTVEELHSFVAEDVVVHNSLELVEKTSRRQHHRQGAEAAIKGRDGERWNSHRRRLVHDDARWPTTRRAVLVRDDFTCVDCGLVDPTGTELVPDHDPRSIVEILDDAYVVGLSLEAAIAEALHHDTCKTRCLSCSGRAHWKGH